MEKGTLESKITDAILGVLNQEKPNPQEGLEKLTTAYCNVVGTVGQAMGYDGNAFLKDLLTQLINQVE